MDLQKRIDLVLRNTAEVITPQDVQTLLETNNTPRAYWGFECSGLLHIGIGLVCSAKIKHLVKAGFKYTIFLADWHSWINNKLGGEMENIRTCGEYLKQIFTALGLGPDKVEFRWASDITDKVEYWEKVVRIAKSVSVNRTWRALPVMGRETSLKDIETAWVFYPCMQAADIYALDIDVACSGIDQRKAHMLARDAAEKLKWPKPVCVHTPLLIGLQGPQTVEREFGETKELNVEISSKMSKSIPQSSILVHDSVEDISSKIKNAYCPAKIVKNNPVLELARLIIYPEMDVLEIPRPAKYGGPETFESFEALANVYSEGKIHPLDLKNGVTNSLTKILEPVREHFSKNPETLEKMLKIEITR
ncbi:MAG: tyrosine--tRNA ligase [Candidatus Bathyarchaeota archaeon]|nr:tyrosine--tRNA ligase [Candidatus Bathyarchaeum tardum]WGM88646.1 MAG: tyrosine--tRNA ligase [Candidatus Bathyarchaeum tardum]